MADNNDSKTMEPAPKIMPRRNVKPKGATVISGNINTPLYETLKAVLEPDMGKDGVPLIAEPKASNESGPTLSCAAAVSGISTPEKGADVLPKADVITSVEQGQAAGGSSGNAKVNFRRIDAAITQEGVDVVLPKESVRVVQDMLAFTLFGYFLGDRIAYPVVDYFAHQNWVKHGLQKIMMNVNGFFFFKFADEKGMLAVLEGGPWLIRNRPIFLNCWSPTSQHKKEDITQVVVWVKLHNIPLAAYTDDGLSMIASKLGNPKRLDSYTSAMCSDTWGRSSYARALIEISAAHDLMDGVTVAIPELEGDPFVTETVKIEYEWTPPRCSHCCVFGHLMATCPKQVIPTPKAAPKTTHDQGFTDVRGKNGTKEAGFQVKTQKPKFEYRPVTGKAKTSDKAAGASTSTVKPKTSDPVPKQHVSTSNSFGALSGEGKFIPNEEDEYDEDADFYGYDGYDGYEMDDFMVQRIKSKKDKEKEAGKGIGSPLIKRGFLG